MLSLLSRRAVASRQPALAVRAFRTAPIARELNEGDQGTGKCKWFDASRGFGFIEAGEEDLFVHFSGIEGKGFRSLAEGEPVEFTVTRGDRGKLQAVQVTGPEGARHFDLERTLKVLRYLLQDCRHEYSLTLIDEILQRMSDDRRRELRFGKVPNLVRKAPLLDVLP